MPRNGLSKDRVVEAAMALIDQFGTAEFSMRMLAESLNVRTASLYNHVESMDSLLLHVCARALEMQKAEEMQAMEGKSGADAVFALARTYRQFARTHGELYRLMMNTAVSCAEQFGEISRCIVDPFMKVLEETTLTDEQKCHWQRVLRGMVHGFVSQEDAGFFSHLPADVDESFHIAIQCYVDGLAQAERCADRKEKGENP